MEYRVLGRTGEKIAAIGLGTWMIGGGTSPDYSRDRDAIEVIRYAIELGMTHIDTAEMYGGGHAEELVGEAIRGFKSHIDLYYIHWPSDVIPLSETMRAMERLYRDGKIRYIGVSNFSIAQVEEARSYLSTADVVAIQAEYSLYNRKIEGDLMQYCLKNGMTLVAYSPLARGALIADLSKPMERRVQLLLELAEKYSKTPIQVALNWVIWRDQVIAIPKASRKEHVEENVGAAGWKLAKEDYDLISRTW